MPHQLVRVSRERLREIFAAQFEHRIASGQYTLNERKRAPPAKGGDLPLGTMSTIFEILDNQGSRLGTVHAMILPDGTIGGSGRYDPKELLVGNRRYLLERPPTH